MRHPDIPQYENKSLSTPHYRISIRDLNRKCIYTLHIGVKKKRNTVSRKRFPCYNVKPIGFFISKNIGTRFLFVFYFAVGASKDYEFNIYE